MSPRRVALGLEQVLSDRMGRVAPANWRPDPTDRVTLLTPRPLSDPTDPSSSWEDAGLTLRVHCPCSWVRVGRKVTALEGGD